MSERWEEGTRHPERRFCEVAIVGGGPAGLTAGLYCARAALKTVLFEEKVAGGQLWNTQDIEDYPGFRHVTGAELAQRFEEHARDFGLDIQPYAVQEVYADGELRVVRTLDGPEYAAAAVIVCSGGEPVKLGVPGEEELAGRGVSYCAVCDGPFFQDQEVAVVGGGDSAFQEALFLTRYARRVHLIHRRDEFRASAVLQGELSAHPKVNILRSHQVEGIEGQDRVEAIRLRDAKTGETRRLDVDGVFIFVGFRPRSRLFRDHVRHDASLYLLTDDRMETSIPGVFAAGDVRAQLARQITTAVGDGTTAALAAAHRVEELRREGVLPASGG